jgi:hypothetical protein
MALVGGEPAAASQTAWPVAPRRNIFCAGHFSIGKQCLGIFMGFSRGFLRSFRAIAGRAALSISQQLGLFRGIFYSAGFIV